MWFKRTMCNQIYSSPQLEEPQISYNPVLEREPWRGWYSHPPSVQSLRKMTMENGNQWSMNHHQPPHKLIKPGRQSLMDGYNLFTIWHSLWWMIQPMRWYFRVFQVYVLLKILTEEKAFQFAREKGIDLVSLIPPTVAGPFLTPTVPSSLQVLLSPVTGNSYRFFHKKIVNTKSIFTFILEFWTLTRWSKALSDISCSTQ